MVKGPITTCRLLFIVSTARYHATNDWKRTMKMSWFSQRFVSSVMRSLMSWRTSCHESLSSLASVFFRVAKNCSTTVVCGCIWTILCWRRKYKANWWKWKQEKFVLEPQWECTWPPYESSQYDTWNAHMMDWWPLNIMLCKPSKYLV